MIMFMVNPRVLDTKTTKTITKTTKTISLKAYSVF